MNPHCPKGYGATYYEAEQKVIRRPCDSYSSEYRVPEYANPCYSMGPHHNNGGYTERVTEVVSYESNPHDHHHGGIAGIVETAGDIVYETTHAPFRKMC